MICVRNKAALPEMENKVYIRRYFGRKKRINSLCWNLFFKETNRTSGFPMWNSGRMKILLMELCKLEGGGMVYVSMNSFGI